MAGRADVQVREQVAQAHLARELEREIRAHDTVRRLGVVLDARRRHRVAEGLEHGAQERLAFAAANHREVRGERDGHLRDLSLIDSPRIAVANTRESAMLIHDDAT